MLSCVVNYGPELWVTYRKFQKENQSDIHTTKLISSHSEFGTNNFWMEKAWHFG